MTKEQKSLLKILCESNGYVACDGKDRVVAQSLEKLRLADWKGTNWGSSFWAATDRGRFTNGRS